MTRVERHNAEGSKLVWIKKATKVIKILCILGFLAVASCIYRGIDTETKHEVLELSTIPASTKVENDKSNSLAMEQSYGYFTDFTDDAWKMKQMIHAALFPNFDKNQSKHNDNTVASRNSHRWYGNNFHVEFSCPFARRLPPDSYADGPKWVCDPHRLMKKKDCLVYSVGCAGKVEFETGVKQNIGDHCEIHTFDIKASRGNRDFARIMEPYGEFHHWGLGNDTQASSDPKIKTLNQTMDELGHTGRTIDIFKIDCEDCEWDVWKDWLTVDMRQILVETHTPPMPEALDLFFNLHDAGYVIFSKEPNYLMGAKLIEYGFVKLSQDFFVNGTMYKNLEK